ncbi:uncharacterized protein J3R85_006434 [Psidium guajava]|nr:uncharacterized protein J3R85_006434 [Psidium guajava]
MEGRQGGTAVKSIISGQGGGKIRYPRKARPFTSSPSPCGPAIKLQELSMGHFGPLTPRCLSLTMTYVRSNLLITEGIPISPHLLINHHKSLNHHHHLLLAPLTTGAIKVKVIKLSPNRGYGD